MTLQPDSEEATEPNYPTARERRRAPKPGPDGGAGATVEVVSDPWRRAQERLDDVMVVARLSFWETGPDLGITRVASNIGLPGMSASGPSNDDVIGKTPWEAVGADPDRDEGWRRHRATLVARRPFRDFRFALSGPDGRTRHLRTSGNPIYDTQGHFRGYRGVSVDETPEVEAERKQVAAESLLRDAIDSISEGFVIFDAEDRLVMHNATFRSMLYPNTLAEGESGMSFEELLRRSIERGDYPAEAWGREEEWIQERLAQHRNPGGAVEQRLNDGRWVLLSERRMMNGGVAGLRMDITALKKAEEALRRSEERYALALEGSNDSLWDWDLRQGKIYSSRHAQEALGHGSAAAEWDAEDWVTEIHPDDLGKFRKDLNRYMKGKTELFECEIRVRGSDGGYRWVILRGKGLRDDKGRVYRMAGSARDVTAQKEAEARVRFLAYHDPLTGLANQQLLNIQIKQAMAAYKRNRRGGALMVIEIDNFRDIVASVGVAKSDILLAQLAERLKLGVRPSDTVARCGTNLFALLATEFPEADGAISVANRVLALFADAFPIDGSRLFFTPSLGIATFPDNGVNPDILFRNAMTALASVGAMDRHRYCFYSEDLTRAAVHRLNLQQQLRQAIDGGDLDVYYEPQVDLRHRNRIVGVEALVRWRHPERGLVLPEEFIPIAEQSGLIAPLGEMVLRKACSQLCAWQTEQDLTFPISVNVSREQLRGGDFGQTVLAVLADTGLSPTDLVLELTESTVLHDLDKVRDLMDELTRVGVRFAIDDFGVEHSALSHLVHLPVSTIKIDRIFVSQVTEDDRFAAIVQAILSMAKIMNKKTTAEGVETQDQLRFLHASGGDFAQGHFFCKALPAAEFLQYLRHHAVQ